MNGLWLAAAAFVIWLSRRRSSAVAAFERWADETLDVFADLDAETGAPGTVLPRHLRAVR